MVPYNSVGYGPATVVDVTAAAYGHLSRLSGNGAKDVEYIAELRTEFPADAYIGTF